MNRLKAVAAISLMAAGTMWWWWDRPRPSPYSLSAGACRGCNVLIVTIDTLRADRVGAYGGRAGLTPNLDRLASEGFRLTRAYSAAPLTLPSHASILTAVSPPIHGVRANGLFRLGAKLPTLATVLKSAGYRTGAFVGAFVLDARFGLNRGFDVYDDRYGEQHAGDSAEGARRRAEEVITPATAWIVHGAVAPGTAARGTVAPSTAPGTMARSTMAPFFAWIHLYDPHEPYHAPDPYASRYEPYDAAVAYADAMVGRLLDDLRNAGRLNRTLVVVAADHGESLGEHAEQTHGVFAYDVTLRVPWIIWAGPQLVNGRGRSSDSLTRLIDLAPTTLDLVGVPAPAEFEGHSLTTASSGRDAAPAPAYFEAMDANLTRNWAPLTGVVTGDFKLIDLPIPELYDLAADPGETRNLFSRNPERARTLGALLRDTTAALASRGGAAERATLGAESRQRLQALGYVGSSTDPGQRVYTDADDPKTMIEPSNDLNRAVQSFNGGSRGQAMAAVREIIARHPRFSTAYGELAAMQRQSGDLSSATSTLEGIVRQDMADYRVMVVLAGYLAEGGQIEKSRGLLEAVIAAHPDSVDAHNSLGVIAMRVGQHDRAQASFRKALELDPTSATAYANLGADELAARSVSAAVEDLKRAVGLDPRQYDALYNLALALYETGRRHEARPYLEQFVHDAPPDRYREDLTRFRALLAQPITR